MAGIQVNQECVIGFNDFKFKSDGTYMIFRLSEDFKQVIIEKMW